MGIFRRDPEDFTVLSLEREVVLAVNLVSENTG